MANETPPDPGAAFREWVTQWERSFDAMANQLMGTEGFSQAMNEFQKSQLSAQRMFAENMTQFLTNMNMPTREDILRLGEAVQGLDRRLERIEAQLSIKSDTAAPRAKRVPRTKQPAGQAEAKAGDGKRKKTGSKSAKASKEPKENKEKSNE